MIQFIQTVLLIFIAWFLYSQKDERMANLFGKQRKIILDSCALIDGRVVQIVNTGFVADELIIPQFILNELQMLADGSDSHKRERARFGLDIANQLQDTAPVKVTIDRTVFAEAPIIDDKLVLLAKKLKAQLYTTDYNLGKVAAVEGVKVLNVNELAQNLRPITLPGETLKIKIIQKGSSRDQGVGYLEDGTMIVVDNGARYVNKVVPVTVTRMHQTVAGKMVFGQVRDGKQSENQGKAQAQPTPPSEPQQRQSRQEHAEERLLKAVDAANGDDDDLMIEELDTVPSRHESRSRQRKPAPTPSQSRTTSPSKLQGRLRRVVRRRPQVNG
ncbi:MAG TPA: TRAM domain-containing protein [Candidatus Saccharimonadales bacterium]|nr:TRAM domain-containing protein [Candidatus Saccharimonadales bacterium]